MHTVDIIAVCAAVLVLVVAAAILARQRYMLRMSGSLPMAVQRGNRWLYGIARYQGGELRWYRAIGIGTRPSRVLRRGEVEVVARRGRSEAERNALPAAAVILECRTDDETFALALGDSAYTGFVSWLESSAPRA